MARSKRSKYDSSSSRSRSSSSASSSSSSSSSASSSSQSSSSSSSSRSSSSSSSSSSSASSVSRRSRSKSRDKASSSSGFTKIRINRLTKNVNKNHILEIFKSYGPIRNVDLPFDKWHPHLSRGSAFVEYERPDDAAKALRFMDGGQIDGQEISVAKCL